MASHAPIGDEIHVIKIRDRLVFTAELVVLVDRTTPDPEVETGFVELYGAEFDHSALQLMQQLYHRPPWLFAYGPSI